MNKKKIIKRLEDAMTITKLAGFFAFSSIFWLMYAVEVLLSRNSVLFKYKLPIDFVNLDALFFSCLYVGGSYLLFLILKKIIKARRKMRVSILKLYLYWFILLLHNFVIMYLYYCQLFTSWKSLLITIPISLGLVIGFILRMTKKDDKE